MQKDTVLVTASYLTTEEDYRNYRMAVRHLRISGIRRACFLIAGVIIMAAGAALLYFYSGGFYDNLAWFALVVVGMFCASYYDVLVPYLTRRQANAAFAQRSRILVAQNISLYPDHFQVNTDRYIATVPYNLLYKCVEDATMFLFYTGMDEVRFLPKRVLTEGEAEQLSAALRGALKERFHG